MYSTVRFKFLCWNISILEMWELSDKKTYLVTVAKQKAVDPQMGYYASLQLKGQQSCGRTQKLFFNMLRITFTKKHSAIKMKL